MDKTGTKPDSSTQDSAGIEIPALEPCPKCWEPKRLSADIHPGITYVSCEMCHYRGPELVPRSDVPRRENLAAVVHAWNNVPR
jgi:hypothetical protein